MAAAESIAANLFVRAKGWQAAGLLIILALAAVFAAPAAAEAQPPNAALNSTGAMLRWINAYRGKPEPDPLANDKDNLDNLTTGSAAKFTLASNAVRDLHLLAMLKRAVKGQPEDVAKVLNDVIDTAENVDTVRMRKESLAAIEDLNRRARTQSANSRPGAKSVKARCRWAASLPRRPGRSSLAFLA